MLSQSFLSTPFSFCVLGSKSSYLQQNTFQLTQLWVPTVGFRTPYSAVSSHNTAVYMSMSTGVFHRDSRFILHQVARTITAAALRDEGVTAEDGESTRLRITVNVQDLGQPARRSSATLIVSVRPAGTDAPVFTQSVYSVTVSENAQIGNCDSCPKGGTSPSPRKIAIGISCSTCFILSPVL